jgi:hypothetical protein
MLLKEQNTTAVVIRDTRRAIAVARILQVEFPQRFRHVAGAKYVFRGRHAMVVRRDTGLRELTSWMLFQSNPE